MWRWKVMSPTSITTSLGNPVVQNLKTTDAQIRSEITGQQITKQVKGDRKQLLHLPCLAFGAGRRRLLLLPPPLPLPFLPTSHLPRGLPPLLHSNPFKTSNGEAFLGRTSGLCFVGIREGEELARESQ